MFSRFAAGVILALGTWGAADAAPPKTIPDLDRALGQAFADGHIPGATVAIVENGQVVFAKGYGYADVARKIPATADTPFRAGSISKAITSIAVMTLVEQGRLSLDDTLARLAPQVHFVNPWEKSDPVRLVNLLEHTTGWPDISTRVLSKDEKDWSLLQGVQFTMGEFTSRWRPGRFTVYNNAGPAVAGLAIEKAGGKPYDDYVRDAVLRPMGMGTADFALPPDLEARIAKSYGPDGSVTPYQYIVLRPAGSLNVSARELAQLVRFYIGRGTVDGRKLLSPASVDRIEHAQSNLGATVGFFKSYALGNAAFPDTGITFRGHNGSIDSFTAVMGYNARSRSGYVLMANGGDGVDFATPVSQLVQNYLTRGLKMAPPPTATVAPAGLEAFAGFYRTITPPNTLLRPYAELLGITRVSAGDGKLVISGNDWLPVSANAFRRADREDASLAFVARDGHVYKIGAFNAQVKEPVWLIAGIWAVAGIIVLGTVTGVLAFLFGIVGMIRGRTSGASLLLRALPLLAVIALAVNLVLPFLAYANSGATAVRGLAEVGPYSLAILAGNLLFPILAMLGLMLAIAGRGTHLFVRGYVALTSIALLAVAGYFAAIGWLPLLTWNL